MAKLNKNLHYDTMLLNTKLAILEKHALAKINEIIDTNFVSGQMFFCETYIKKIK